VSSKPLWMVRAGEGGYLFEEFKARSVVTIDWAEMGDMSALKTREQFVKAVERSYPQNSKNQVATSAGQAFRFVREMKPGDRVEVVGYALASGDRRVLRVEYLFAQGKAFGMRSSPQ